MTQMKDGHQPIAMSIAGSDSSCGAGIQVDLRMFSARGVYGTTVLTALTAQNPLEVRAVQGLEAVFVQTQMETVLDKMPVAAIKTGMLWSAEIIKTVSTTLKNYAQIPCVVDPVMIATSGAQLITDDAVEAYKNYLFPQCTLATPNIDEAQVLLGQGSIGRESQEDAARTLFDKLGCSILLKGGHLQGDPVDLLFDGKQVWRFEQKRLENVNTHGSGCMLSAAIAAELAKKQELQHAVGQALKAVHVALANPSLLTSELSLAAVEVARD